LIKDEDIQWAFARNSVTISDTKADALVQSRTHVLIAIICWSFAQTHANNMEQI